MIGAVDLFMQFEPVEILQPWKPRALDHDEWPCDYRQVYEWRRKILAELQSDPVKLQGALDYYSIRPHEFIMHWMDTYDPRKIENSPNPELRGVKWMPFVFFNKQYDIITMFHELRNTGEDGLIEKCRDAGVTWLACAYAVWSWRFIDNDTIGFGSRKQELVDRIGDASSIFEKIRLLIRRLPKIFRPAGLSMRDHLKSMNITNPANGSAIVGEIGRNIGRGGRTSMYFKDESAHYEHPEDIEAALGDNTNVQIDISSVNGLGNVFHRRREGGMLWEPGNTIESGFVRVCIVDWRDHPNKTQEWYDKRRAKFEREGLLHVFSQEVDRDYGASQQHRIIDPEWIDAAIDAHLKIPYLVTVDWPNVHRGGLDVGDSEDGDRNAFFVRQSIIARYLKEWVARDPAVTARIAIDESSVFANIEIEYDCIGVGASVKSEYNRLTLDEKLIIPKFNPWNAGDTVVNPFYHIIEDDDETPMNKDMFGNFKAQAWWHVRTLFYKTWRAVKFGEVYKIDELISLDSSLPLLAQLKKELAQPQKTSDKALRMIIDKRPDGVRSPNCADSLVMSYFPAPQFVGVAVGRQGI